MPWQTLSPEQQRWQFVCAVHAATDSFTATCRRFGISRKSGYKWWRRFREEDRILVDRSHRPRRSTGCNARWRGRVFALRQRWRHWGARKLRWELKRRWPRAKIPAVRTVHRWLFAAGLTRRGKRRARPGPVVALGPPQRAIRSNDVWTADFKGRAYTTDGTRVEPLTVRDLATRYGLAIRQLPRNDETQTRRAFVRIFRRNGRPKAIQIDNGPPFAGDGALGLSRLSVWWLRLGIRVQFGRPACPQDNAAHEQWHSVISAETFKPMSHSVVAQQRRFNASLHHYNFHRPHESLGMQPPAKLYRRSRRQYSARLPQSSYRANWPRLLVDPLGRVSWAGRQRLIGRAFAGQRVGLCPSGAQQWQVYLDRHLIGLLVAADLAGMRPTQVRRYSNGAATKP